MRNKRKSNVIFRVALVLFCLVLFSAHISSGILAKYRFDGDESNSARPAKSEVTVTSEMTAPLIAADGTATYDFTVANTGEVPLRYSLVVYLKPGVVSSDEADVVFSNVMIDGAAGTYDAVDQAYYFADCGELEADPEAHTLTFETSDFVTVSGSVDAPVHSWKDVTVIVAVTTEQID